MRIRMIVPVLFMVLFYSAAASAQEDIQPSIDRGKKVYESVCLACHQANGSGVPGLNPPLKQTEWVLGNKDSLINIVLKGFDKPIEIKGKFFENVMPAQPQLKDQEIADVLTYIRNSFTNKASAVTANEVKKMRSK